jgi:hypothetical protein
MPDCPASGQSSTGMNKNSDPEPLRYRTEIPDAGMPMPAASASMPMPRNGLKYCKEIFRIGKWNRKGRNRDVLESRKGRRKERRRTGDA